MLKRLIDPLQSWPEHPAPGRPWSTMVGLCLISACLLASCSREEKAIQKIEGDTTPVIATVGTQPITMQMLQRIAAQNGYDLREEKGREMALRDAVNFELLAREAARRGYREHPDIEHYVKTQSVQRLLADTVDAEPGEAVAVSDAELRSYYDEHVDEFTPPTMARARVLALLKRQGQEEAFARKLEAVNIAIVNKAVPFGEMVQQFSDDPAAKSYGGMTNWLMQGEENKRYPSALIHAVFSAEDKTTIHGPIAHNQWTYFVQLHERRGGAASTFEQSKGRIAKQLKRAKRLEAYDRFVGKLKADNLRIETHPEKVAEQIEAITRSSGPPTGPVSVNK